MIYVCVSFIILAIILVLILILSKKKHKDNYCYPNEDLKLVSKGAVFPNNGISFVGYNYYIGNGKGALPIPDKGKETLYIVSKNKPDNKVFAVSDFNSDFSKMIRQMMPSVIVFTDGTGKGMLFPVSDDTEKQWFDLSYEYNNDGKLYLYSLKDMVDNKKIKIGDV